MTRVRIAFALCAAIVLVTALSAGSPAQDRRLYAFMDGKSEVPDRGDPNGHARITITFKRAARQVCYDIRKHQVETAVAAHIHRGVRGKAGSVVVAFFGSPKGAGRGRITGCARNVSRTRIDQILSNPRRYYANLHTRTYPGGSVRGQLSTRRR